MNRVRRLRRTKATIAIAIAAICSPLAHAAPLVRGQVLDLNGMPLNQAMVTLAKASDQPGPTAVTVFTGPDGRFEFPANISGGNPTVKLLNYRMMDGPSTAPAGQDLLITMRPDSNQVGIAPASAYLRGITDPNDRVEIISRCVGCHQFPAPEAREYIRLIDNMPGVDRQEARRQSWAAIAAYMTHLSVYEFTRGVAKGTQPQKSPQEGNLGEGQVFNRNYVSDLLTRVTPASVDRLEGYQYNAPLIVDARTVIREYEVPRPNNIREGLTLADPGTIWLSDEDSDKVFRVNTVSGAVSYLEVPHKDQVAPHSIYRGPDDTLWVSGFFNGILAHLDPKTEKWKTWQLPKHNGTAPMVHDLSADTNREVAMDARGRIWYSDISHDGLGWLDPKTGKSGMIPIPKVAGRPANGLVYGLTMSTDRKRLWYAQLGNGCVGAFNTQTMKFEDVLQFPEHNSGPRRIAMSDSDVLYIALFGTGQLAEYDTRTHTMVGVYDLPDRASAPYALTWDPVRQVIWVPTSNTNVIYRFDPRDKSFGVLPMPREQAYLRMVDIDKTTGALVTSYANLVEPVYGPRMAVMIDLGDGAKRSAAEVSKQ